MPKRRKEQLTELPLNPNIHDRIRWLLATLWHNNESQMARSLGTSQTTIWRAVDGKRPPGRELLQSLAAHPKINPAWLMTGVGEPLLAEREEQPKGRGLPISREPLPGPPGENREILTGETFSLARVPYRRSRYWLEIQGHDPITADRGQRVVIGDLLLMDSDRTGWTQPENVQGRLCVVQIQDTADGKPKPKLGRVDYYPGSEDEPASLTVDTFERPVNPADVERVITIRGVGPGPLQATEHHVSKATGSRVSQIQIGSYPQPISLDQIWAVCVMLVRRSP